MACRPCIGPCCVTFCHILSHLLTVFLSLVSSQSRWRGLALSARAQRPGRRTGNTRRFRASALRAGRRHLHRSGTARAVPRRANRSYPGVFALNEFAVDGGSHRRPDAAPARGDQRCEPTFRPWPTWRRRFGRVESHEDESSPTRLTKLFCREAGGFVQALRHGDRSIGRRHRVTKGFSLFAASICRRHQGPLECRSDRICDGEHQRGDRIPGVQW